MGKRTTPMVRSDYEALFDGVAQEAMVGEVSPQYLYLPDCCDRIYQDLPDAKLIAVLRNPAERAFSAYAYQLTCGYDTEHRFEEALDLEPQRVREKWRPVWHYQSLGFYYQQLNRFFQKFPAENIGVFFYDDLSQDAIAFSQSVYAFLGVDASFVPETSVKNVSGQPKNRAMHNLLNRDNPVKSVVKSLVPQGARQSMGKFLKQKIRNLNPHCKGKQRLS
ncbi:MAG: sulfotransferase [Acaryochloridaceae cyanobacterium RL_2_7]|nr:sulfotransferase [Acaryochloridaceae cyanobacterium RL_2_7]